MKPHVSHAHVLVHLPLHLSSSFVPSFKHSLPPFLSPSLCQPSTPETTLNLTWLKPAKTTPVPNMARFMQPHPTPSSPTTPLPLLRSWHSPYSSLSALFSSITGTGTALGIAVVTPLFVISSPVLLPAAFLIGLAVAGILTSGAFGVTALASFTWLANYLRRSRLQEQLEYAKNRAEETISQAAQSVKGAGEGVLSKVQETGQGVMNKAQETRQKSQGDKRSS